MKMLKERTLEFRKEIAALPREDILEILEAQDPKLIDGVKRIDWVFENKLSHIHKPDGTPVLESPLTNDDLALLVDEPFEVNEQLTDYGISISQQKELHISMDPVMWAREVLGLKLRSYQMLIARNPSLRKVLRAGRRLGKALDVNTPIPTPDGWKTMGDLECGDKVFDENGNVTNVTFVTDFQYGRKCYEVKFSDGSTIIADADHQWTVDTKASRKARGRAVNPQKTSITLTTQDMIGNLYVKVGGGKEEVNYSIDIVNNPVQYPSRDLLIDPYVLGIWLGDGSSHDGRIHTADEDILLELKRAGYETTQSTYYEYTYQVYGLNSLLRKQSLLENKHIPSIYLTASEEQRWALLQGLMDSDGTCSNDGQGTCEISQKNERLALDILELIHSLGMRATIRSESAKLYEKDYGLRHRISFTPWKEVFRLGRKLERQNLASSPSARQRCRYIVDIKEVESRPVKCISVDSDSSLYLAGKSFIPTHNTATMALMALHYAWTTKNGRVIVITPMKPQGGLIYEEIIKWASNSDIVSNGITRNVTSPQYEINFINGSTIRFFSSGTKSGGKCLTPDHDVLTRDGWKPIADVVVGEEVASLDDGNLVWKDTTNVWQYDYDDELIIHDNKQISFAVTPNHKVLTKTNPHTEYRFRTAAQLKGMHYFPASGNEFKREGEWFSAEELELWGWWLSEGSGFIGKMARISQSKTHGRDRIIELAEKLGLHYTTPSKEIRVEWKPPIECGTNAYNKFIPRLLFEEKNLPSLFDGLMGGDGYRRRQGWEYSSSSWQLINDVQELSFRLGWRARLAEKKLADKYPPHWRVSIYPREYAIATPSSLGRENYTGQVHCLTVQDTGTFFVRRNGKMHLTGNSDVTRGQEAHVIILDEMDYMHPDDLIALYAMLQQTEENQPDKLLIGASTPTGRQEVFYDWCTDPSEGFKEFWFPSYVNPFFTKEMEDELRVRYTEMGYRHEIEADWGEPADGVYPRKYIDKAFSHKNWNYRPESKLEPNTFHVMGVDWDKYRATPNIVILKVYRQNAKTEYLRGKIKLVYREALEKDKFVLSNAVDRIIQLNSIFEPEHIYVDRGMGEVQVEMLIKHGIKNKETGLQHKVRGVAFRENIEIISPYNAQRIKKDAKAFMVENLRTFLEEEKLWIPDSDSELFKQLIAYVVTISPSGNRRFESSGSAEDHIHDALCLACLAITENHGDFAQAEIATKGYAINPDPFLALLDISENAEEYSEKVEEAEDNYGSITSAPVMIKRRMTHSSSRSRARGSRPIKRKMF